MQSGSNGSRSSSNSLLDEPAAMRDVYNFPSNNTPLLVNEPPRLDQAQYRPAAPTHPPQSPHYHVNYPVETSSKSLRWFSIIGAMIASPFIFGFIFIVTYTTLYILDQPTEADLIRTTTARSTYLRPKQWTIVPDIQPTAYGDERNKREITARIRVRDDVFLAENVMSLSESDLNKFRLLMFDSVQSADLNEHFIASEACTKTSNIQKQINHNKSSTMAGLWIVTAQCVNSGNTHMLFLDTSIGNDGYIRHTTFVANIDNWNRNKDLYKKMIESVGQSTDTKLTSNSVSTPQAPKALLSNAVTQRTHDYESIFHAF